jgi:hypothetical protein
MVPGDSPDALGAPITQMPQGAGSQTGTTPVVTGAPVKRGSGTGFSFAEIRAGDALRTGMLASSQDGSTIMVVARLLDTVGTQTIFYNGPTGSDRWDLTLFPSGTERLRYVYSTSDGKQATHPWVPDTEWHVFTVTRTATAVNIGVDLQFKSTTDIAPNRPFGTFQVGQRRNTTAADLLQNIDVAEVLISPSPMLTEYRNAEIKNLMAYYGMRWGDDIRV